VGLPEEAVLQVGGVNLGTEKGNNFAGVGNEGIFGSFINFYILIFVPLFF
jgi:hypothetical protein